MFDHLCVFLWLVVFMLLRLLIHYLCSVPSVSHAFASVHISFLFLCLVFLMLLHLFIAALWSPAGKWLTSWHLAVMFIVLLVLSHVVSWVRCGT